jgi:hypothetical protein
MNKKMLRPKAVGGHLGYLIENWIKRSFISGAHISRRAQRGEASRTSELPGQRRAFWVILVPPRQQERPS